MTHPQQRENIATRRRLPWRRFMFTVTALVSGDAIAAVAVDVSAYFQSEAQYGRVAAETKLGPVIGRLLPSGVRAFLGIPYALPPIGKLRFEPPVPLESWGGGKLEAVDFGAECMQSVADTPTPPGNISEDCLFLNVWAPPGARKGSKFPVMVWLYGGGFQQGSSSHPEYDGERLAERGVVVVSINYRLGALGWMVSVTDNLWGNYGLQDQRLGMEWVHDNVAGFGGDPGRVTLFGESAGAMSISQHLHMEGAGVLFHQVVMQSNPVGYRFRSVTVANFLGEAMKRGLDCFSLGCLQTEPASEVMRVQESFMAVPRSVGDFFTWGPVITDRNYRRHVGKHQKTWSYDEDEAKAELEKGEKILAIGGKKPDKSGLVRLGPSTNYTAPFMRVAQPLEVMTEAATSAAKRRQQRQHGRAGDEGEGDESSLRAPIPVMLGVNADEGLMFVHGAFPLTMPKLVYYSFVTALFRTSMIGVLRAYGHLARQCAESGDYRRVMSHIMHDYLFRCPNLRAAQLLQEQNGRDAPVFVYEFSHPTEVPGFPECSGSSCHTAELPYVFNNLDVISGSYSYHEASGPAAPRPAPSGEGLDALNEGGDEGGGGIGNALSVVGSAVGGVAGGVAGTVVGAVRSGFGVGRLLRRQQQSPGEEVVGAIGVGGVGFAGNIVSDVLGSKSAAPSAVEGDAVVVAEAPAAGEKTPPGEGEGAVGGLGDSGKVGDAAAVSTAGVGGDLEASEGIASATAASASDGRDEAGVAASSSPEGAAQKEEEEVEAGYGTGGGVESDSGGGERGLGGSSCAAMAGEDIPMSPDVAGSARRRPSVSEAASADALVADAMVNYWASFGKAGDPNNANAPVLWPAWEGRRLAAQGNTAGTAAMAAMLASGRGGIGKGSFSDVFSHAWSQAGTAGGEAAGTWGGGSFFLEIKARPQVQEAQRDCLCEFWDRLKYRH